MLINDKDHLIRTPFVDEAEIEGVVQKFSEQLFGSSIIFLPKAKISTVGGKGTVPDGFVIDIQSEEWFVVEAERAIHGTWQHIAPQISKQLAAIESTKTRELVLRLALDSIKKNRKLREIFGELGIGELEIHGKLQAILGKQPTIAIPIDGIPKDLKEWARTLRNPVKIWLIEKYVSRNDPNYVLYSVPEETAPTITTETSEGKLLSAIRTRGSQPFQELLDSKMVVEGQTLFLEYGPRGKKRMSYKGIVRNEGIEVENQVFSPSYAAVHCIQKAGSHRNTANGWTMWKNEKGEYLDDLYNQISSSNLGENEE